MVPLPFFPSVNRSGPGTSSVANQRSYNAVVHIVNWPSVNKEQGVGMGSVVDEVSIMVDVYVRAKGQTKRMGSVSVSGANK